MLDLDQIADVACEECLSGSLVHDEEFGSLGIFRVFLKLPKRINDIVETWAKQDEKGKEFAPWRQKKLARELARLVKRQLAKKPNWRVSEAIIEILSVGGQEQLADELEDLMDSRGDKGSSPPPSGSSGVDALVSAVNAAVKSGDKAAAKSKGRDLAAALEKEMESSPGYEPSDAVFEALDASGVADEVFGVARPALRGHRALSGLPKAPRPPSLGSATAAAFRDTLARRSFHNSPYRVGDIWVVPSQVSKASRHNLRGRLLRFMQRAQVEHGVAAAMYRTGDRFHAVFGDPEDVTALVQRLPQSQVIAHIPPLRGHFRTISHAEMNGTYHPPEHTACMAQFSRVPRR